MLRRVRFSFDSSHLARNSCGRSNARLINSGSEHCQMIQRQEEASVLGSYTHCIGSPHAIRRTYALVVPKYILLTKRDSTVAVIISSAGICRLHSPRHRRVGATQEHQLAQIAFKRVTSLWVGHSKCFTPSVDASL